VVRQRFVDIPQDFTSFGIDDVLLISVVLSVYRADELAPQSSLAMQIITADFLIDRLLETWAIVPET
jgi:hypothetical protein